MRPPCSLFVLAALMLLLAGCHQPSPDPGDSGDAGGALEDLSPADSYLLPDLPPRPDVPADLAMEDRSQEHCNGLRDECPLGQGCYPTGDNQFACLPAGQRGEWDGCQDINDCAPGLGCGEEACWSLCHPSDPSSCPDGRYCMPYSDYDDLGLCLTSPPHGDCQVCDGETGGPVGCPLGDKCTLGMSGLTCDPMADNPAEKGEPCGQAGEDNCGSGLICSGTDPSNFVCQPLCEPLSPSDEDCCEGLCLGFYGYESVNLGVCIECHEPCDVLCQESCPEGQKCTMVGECSTGCVEAGDVGEGEACGALGLDDCAPGLYCQGGVCVEMCRTDQAEHPCWGEATCLGLDPYGQITVGYCGVFPSRCSVVRQGCQEGLKCALGEDNGIACVEAGDRGLGEACQDPPDDCVAGAVCVNAICRQACEPLSHERGCGEEESCFSLLPESLGANIGYCVTRRRECSLTDQDCPKGGKCTLTPLGLECLADGVITLGKPCGEGEDLCQEGGACMALGDEEANCRRLCDTWRYETGCPEGWDCRPLEGYEDLYGGVCRRLDLACHPAPDDCPEGHRCTLMDGATACLPKGPVQEGQACESDEDCVRGLACVALYDPCEPTCEPLCDTRGEPCPDDALGAGRLCSWLGPADLGVCMRLCDPRCRENEVCLSAGYGEWVCRVEDTGQLGEECGFRSMECAEGLVCAGTEDEFICMRLCSPLSDPSGCGEDQICLGFYGMEDIDYGVCQTVLEECSPLCQAGCGPGEKCTYGPDGVQCLLDGTKGLGEACDEDDDCRAGTICLGSEEDGYTCRALCEPEIATLGGWASCGDNEFCMDLGGGGLLAIGYCEHFPQACSVLDQDCLEGMACLLADEPDGQGLYGTVCMPAGEAGWMEPCDEAGCGAGLICLTGGGESLCYQICDPIAHQGCGPDQYCTYFGHPALGAPVGFCQPYSPEGCSLARQDCPDGETCDFAIDASRCVRAGDLPLAAPCDPYHDGCGPGLTCNGASGVYQCMRVCEPMSLPGEQGCPGDEACLGFVSLPNINYGVCQSLSLEGCDISEQGCPDGQSCGYGPAGTLCLPVGQGGLHAPCFDGCDEGLICTGEACRTCEIPCYVGQSGCPPDLPVCQGDGGLGVCASP